MVSSASLRSIFESKAWAAALAVVIVINALLVVAETDASVDDGKAPWSILGANHALLVCYFFELAAKLFATGREFFGVSWNILDLLLVLADVVLLLPEAFHGSMPTLCGLRVLRLPRLAVTIAPELGVAFHGFGGALRAASVGFAALLTVLAMWSVAAVQILHPLRVPGCERCSQAFETVFKSALTLFTMVVTGDGASQIVLPLMERHPATSLFFIGMFITSMLTCTYVALTVVLQILKASAFIGVEAEGEQEIKEHKAVQQVPASEGRIVALARDREAGLAATAREAAAATAATNLRRKCEDLDLLVTGRLPRANLRLALAEPDFKAEVQALGFTPEDFDAFLDVSGEWDAKAGIRRWAPPGVDVAEDGSDEVVSVRYDALIARLCRLATGPSQQSLVAEMAWMHRVVLTQSQQQTYLQKVPPATLAAGSGEPAVETRGRKSPVEPALEAMHVPASERSPGPVLISMRAGSIAPRADDALADDADGYGTSATGFSGSSCVDSMQMSDLLSFPQALRKLADNQERSFQAMGHDIEQLRVQLATSNAPSSAHSSPENIRGILPPIHDAYASAEVADAAQREISDALLGSDSARGANQVVFRLWHSWSKAPSNADTADHEPDLSENDIGADVDENDEEGDFEVEAEEKTSVSFFVASPNSRYRLGWDVVGMMVLCYDLIMIPLQFGFDLESEGAIGVAAQCTLIFWSFDIILAFCVGFYDKRGRLIMEADMIAIHYMKTWFSLDFFIVGLDWVMFILGQGRGASGLMRVGKLFRAMRILRTLRLLRLAKLKQIMAMIQDRLDSEYLTIALSVVKLMVLIVAINHFIACAWFKLGTMEVDKFQSWVEAFEFDIQPVEYQYLSSLHWSLTQFTPASMSVQPVNIGERIFAVSILLFAMIVFSSFVSSITAAMNQLRNMSAKNGSQLWLMRRYLREQHISQDLYLRLTRYASVTAEKLRKHIQQKDVVFLTLLSQPLMIELRTATYKPSLVAHPFLDRCSRRSMALLFKICCTAVKTSSLSRGDVLFMAGEKAFNMFFLTRGSMWYGPSSTSNIEASAIWKVGDWCCEAVLWVPWIHVGKMRAKAESDAIELNAAKFREVAHLYPTQLAFVRLYGTHFVHKLNSVDGMVSDLQPVDEKDVNKMLATCVSTNVLNLPAAMM